MLTTEGQVHLVNSSTRQLCTEIGVQFPAVEQVRIVLDQDQCILCNALEESPISSILGVQQLTDLLRFIISTLSGWLRRAVQGFTINLREQRVILSSLA